MTTLKCCPECGSERVYSTHEQAFMVNTGDHWCHTMKTHDWHSTSGCLDCDWKGMLRDLSEEPSHDNQ